MRKKKKEIVLEKVKVETYAAEGKSLAHIDGKVVFIERTVPGDVVDIRLTKNRKEWAEAYPLQFHVYSNQRVKPFCIHFGVCGGCQWQMLPYDGQLAYKRQQVEDCMRRIAKIEIPEIPEVIRAEKTTQFRNKLEYTFSSKRFVTEDQLEREDKNSDLNAAGFHARRFFDKVVEIEQCHLQAEPSNSIRNAIAAFGRKNNYSFYDYRLHQGFLRTLQVRTNKRGEVMVNLVMGEDDEEKRNRLLEYLVNEVPGISTLLYTINTKWNDSMFDLQPVVISGNGYIMETLGDYRFKIGPKSFFQTNSYQAEKLYAIAMEYAELTGSEILYDLYCGTGSIGLYASKNAKKVIGVELIAEAISDAKENAVINDISHAEFYCGDVIKVCDDDFFSKNGNPDVIITDPPRAGMHEKLVRKILDMNAPLVVYVSCNPSTQARDLSLLDEKYMVTKIQPVDMFPHTHHIENIVQLKRR